MQEEKLFPFSLPVSGRCSLELELEQLDKSPESIGSVMPDYRAQDVGRYKPAF